MYWKIHDLDSSLFPPMKGEVLNELSDNQKSTILYDDLPNYYIKKMKEANTEPIEINIEPRLTLERILRAILRITKSREPKPQFHNSRGVRVKIIRRVEKNPLF
jgi:hypothetical protein